MPASQKVGHSVFGVIQHSSGACMLFWRSLVNVSALRIAPTRVVLYKQTYFTGIQALTHVAAIGTLVGIIIITQVANIVGFNAAIMGKLLVWTVVRELGPLFASIVVIARSATAIASELGSMKLVREIDTLQTMGIDPMRYLVVPRIIGITLAVFILTFYFQVFAIVGGLFISSLVIGIPFAQYLHGVFPFLTLNEVGISLLKAISFGLVISVLSCYHGLRVRSSITEIPQVTTTAVMQSLFLIILIDVGVTLVWFT
jgi:phospholipid/cholesterol/gamma-HCH transport system permease protein